jgi:hypothetical protein
MLVGEDVVKKQVLATAPPMSHLVGTAIAFSVSTV